MGDQFRYSETFKGDHFTLTDLELQLPKYLTIMLWRSLECRSKYETAKAEWGRGPKGVFLAMVSKLVWVISYSIFSDPKTPLGRQYRHNSIVPARDSQVAPISAQAHHAPTPAHSPAASAQAFRLRVSRQFAHHCQRATSLTRQQRRHTRSASADGRSIARH